MTCSEKIKHSMCQHYQDAVEAFWCIRDRTDPSIETERVSKFCLACFRDKDRGLKREVVRYWLDHIGKEEYVYYVRNVFSDQAKIHLVPQTV